MFVLSDCIQFVLTTYPYIVRICHSGSCRSSSSLNTHSTKDSLWVCLHPVPHLRMYRLPIASVSKFHSCCGSFSSSCNNFVVSYSTIAVRGRPLKYPNVFTPLRKRHWNNKWIGLERRSSDIDHDRFWCSFIWTMLFCVINVIKRCNIWQCIANEGHLNAGNNRWPFFATWTLEHDSKSYASTSSEFSVRDGPPRCNTELIVAKRTVRSGFCVRLYNASAVDLE